MKEKVLKFGPITLEEIDTLVKNIITGVTKKLDAGNDVIVSQALYLNKHRLLLQQAFKKYGVAFLHIDTPEEKQYEQLQTRDRGKLWAKYASENDPHFEKPDPCLQAYVIKNKGSLSDLINEFRNMPLHPAYNSHKPSSLLHSKNSFFVLRDKEAIESQQIKATKSTVPRPFFCGVDKTKQAQYVNDLEKTKQQLAQNQLGIPWKIIRAIGSCFNT